MCTAGQKFFKADTVFDLECFLFMDVVIVSNRRNYEKESSAEPDALYGTLLNRHIHPLREAPSLCLLCGLFVSGFLITSGISRTITSFFCTKGNDYTLLNLPEKWVVTAVRFTLHSAPNNTPEVTERVQKWISGQRPITLQVFVSSSFGSSLRCKDGSDSLKYLT